MRFYFRNTFDFRDLIAEWCGSLDIMIDDAEFSDFSVVVKSRAAPPKPWRWEIYRAGRTSPIQHSKTFFGSMTEAGRAGKTALQALLSDYPD